MNLYDLAIARKLSGGGGGGGSADLKGLIEGSIVNLVVPDGTTKLKDNIFTSCPDLETITLPTSLISIGMTAFNANSKLTSLVVPEGVTTIDTNFCYNCTGLKSVELPSTLVSVGNYFCRGANIASLTCKMTTPPTLGNNPWYQATIGAIYVPAASVAAYKAKPGWAQQASIIQAIPE